MDSPTNSNQYSALGHKILIWGGGGKTTLGRVLSAKLDLPFVELDALHWLPDWQQRPADEFKQLVQETLDGINSGWVVASALPCIVILDRWLIEREEQYLLLRFGTDYRDYVRRVRRWI